MGKEVGFRSGDLGSDPTVVRILTYVLGKLYKGGMVPRVRDLGSIPTLMELA